jgi:hypothetical protein
VKGSRSFVYKNLRRQNGALVPNSCVLPGSQNQGWCRICASVTQKKKKCFSAVVVHVISKLQKNKGRSYGPVVKVFIPLQLACLLQKKQNSGCAW